MKKLLLIALLFLIPASAHAVNVVSYSGTLTTTGTTCVDLRGFMNKSYFVDNTAGTVQYDVLLSPTDTPLDLANDDNDLQTDATVGKSGAITTAERFMCITIDSCSSCDVDYWFTGVR